MLSLSVVVPATDRPPCLERCRAALAAATDGPDEIIVVDGPTRLSAAAARNAGAARARGDVIVFVDSDVEVHRDAFTRIRRALEADPDLAAVFGSYDDAPSAPGRVSAFRNVLHHHVHHQSAGPAETFWTGLGAVRRSCFLAAGGFDEQRYPYPSIEDIDLGDRLHRAGHAIELDPAIAGTHLKAWTLRSMVWTDFARRGIPWVALQVRNRRLSSALNCGWRHRASALACVVVLVALALGQLLAAISALGLFVVLNRSFYGLLSRRRGVVDAGLGIGLHALHHLVAVLAVPAGLVVALTTLAGRPDPAPREAAQDPVAP